MRDLIEFLDREIEAEMERFPTGNGPFSPGVLHAIQEAIIRREVSALVKQLPAPSAAPHLKLLAARYSRRPDYRPEWAPTA